MLSNGAGALGSEAVLSPVPELCIGAAGVLAGWIMVSLCTIDSGSRGGSPEALDLGVDAFDGGITSPLATNSAFRASTSAFEGRPRFFGC
jgi:hypothetical protein